MWAILWTHGTNEATPHIWIPRVTIQQNVETLTPDRTPDRTGTQIRHQKMTWKGIHCQAVYIWRGQGVRFLLRGSCLPALKPVYGIYISGSRCEVLIRSGVSCGCKLQLWTLKGWTVSQKYFLKILNWSQEISFSCFSSRFHLTAPSKMHGDPLKSSYFPPHKDERQRPSNQGVPDGTDWWEITIVEI